mmetsp:Transcript_13806/g.20339  ORF Transcript_13806/g.20339 Transcript_13806/m.20339 type:complete len:398 (+) Transcript_13806:272-1465(+)
MHALMSRHVLVRGRLFRHPEQEFFLGDVTVTIVIQLGHHVCGRHVVHLVTQGLHEGLELRSVDVSTSIGVVDVEHPAHLCNLLVSQLRLNPLPPLGLVVLLHCTNLTGKRVGSALCLRPLLNPEPQVLQQHERLDGAGHLLLADGQGDDVLLLVDAEGVHHHHLFDHNKDVGVEVENRKQTDQEVDPEPFHPEFIHRDPVELQDEDGDVDGVDEAEQAQDHAVRLRAVLPEPVQHVLGVEADAAKLVLPEPAGAVRLEVAPPGLVRQAVVVQGRFNPLLQCKQGHGHHPRLVLAGLVGLGAGGQGAGRWHGGGHLYVFLGQVDPRAAAGPACVELLLHWLHKVVEGGVHAGEERGGFGPGFALGEGGFLGGYCRWALGAGSGFGHAGERSVGRLNAA